MLSWIALWPVGHVTSDHCFFLCSEKVKCESDSHPQYSWEIAFMLPTDAEIGGCSGPLHKTVVLAYTLCTSSRDFESSPGPWKCCVKGWTVLPRVMCISILFLFIVIISVKTHCVYPFISWGTSDLFSLFDCYHNSLNISVERNFQDHSTRQFSYLTFLYHRQENSVECGDMSQRSQSCLIPCFFPQYSFKLIFWQNVCICMFSCLAKIFLIN